MSDPLSARQQGRRDFLKTGGAVTAALLAPPAAFADASTRCGRLHARMSDAPG